MKRYIPKLLIWIRNKFSYKCELCGCRLRFSHFHGDNIPDEHSMRMYKCRKCNKEYIAL